jgi:hypothetical protein
MTAEHRDAPNGGTVSDHLTINEREWAYCAKDSRLAGHIWEPTGGVTISEVERFARTRDARRESTVS